MGHVQGRINHEAESCMRICGMKPFRPTVFVIHMEYGEERHKDDEAIYLDRGRAKSL